MRGGVRAISARSSQTNVGNATVLAKRPPERVLADVEGQMAHVKRPSLRSLRGGSDKHTQRPPRASRQGASTGAHKHTWRPRRHVGGGSQRRLAHNSFSSHATLHGAGDASRSSPRRHAPWPRFKTPKHETFAPLIAAMLRVLSGTAVRRLLPMEVCLPSHFLRLWL